VAQTINRLFIALVLIVGPGISTEAAITLPQAGGDSITLTKPARRIITLAPNLAELVFAAGAGDRLEAVVEYSNFPAQVMQLPRVGDAFRIDLERIIEFEPDLVIAWRSGNPQSAVRKLEQLGIRVWQIEITRPEEIPLVVENISLAADTESFGRPMAGKLQRKLEQLRKDNAGKAMVDYFYQISAHPLYTINGRHIISRGLEICGGRNIFSGLPALAPQVSRESVVMADPQAMVSPRVQTDPPELDVWREWPKLQAVQNGALLYLPADEISQATPRLLDSIELACKLLDEVRNTSPKAKR
jgi:iron complex transport system substrate-binding protein